MSRQLNSSSSTDNIHSQPNPQAALDNTAPTDRPSPSNISQGNRVISHAQQSTSNQERSDEDSTENNPQDIELDMADVDEDDLEVPADQFHQVRPTARNPNVRAPHAYRRPRRYIPIHAIYGHRLRNNGATIIFKVAFRPPPGPRKWTYLNHNQYASEIYDYVEGLMPDAQAELISKRDDIRNLMLHHPNRLLD